jgi:hypothetical protein
MHDDSDVGGGLASESLVYVNPFSVSLTPGNMGL